MGNTKLDLMLGATGQGSSKTWVYGIVTLICGHFNGETDEHPWDFWVPYFQTFLKVIGDNSENFLSISHFETQI